MPDRFTFRMTDGATIEGVVQGNAGFLARPHGVGRLRLDMLKARNGHRLSCYEPKPGHVAVYPELTAHNNGPHRYVDLREVAFVEDAMTLTEALAANGLTHRPQPHSSAYKRDILGRGAVVFTGNAHEVWEWLRDTGRWPITGETI
jgi:hypothetical protein